MDDLEQTLLLAAASCNTASEQTGFDGDDQCHIKKGRISTANTCHDGSHDDLESQRKVSARKRWRRWVTSILMLKNLADNVSVALARVSTTSTSFYSIISNDDTEDAQIISSEENPSASPQVVVNVNLGGENDNFISDAKLQQANIVRMVKERDIDSLQKFGGIQGIAVAFDTDLTNGLTGDEHGLRSQRIASALFPSQAPARGFFFFLRKSCKSYNIFLLFVSDMLSFGFGIKEEGLRTGWYEGVIILFAIIILVVGPALRDFWLERSQPMDVDVFRGGRQQKLPICNVLSGDIVCLKRGSQVPADGLFIPGESLRLEDDVEFIIDENNPFMFSGAKVIDGTGRMLVTSVGMDTTWGLMNQVTHGRPDRAALPAKLDKVSDGLQITALSISILIQVVVFLRFMLRKEDVDSSLPDLKGKPMMASKKIISEIKKLVMKPNGKISTLTTSLSMLVGIMEGIPFVITLAIFYGNKKMLSDKAIAKYPLACLAMASVTTIGLDKTCWQALNPQVSDVSCTETRIATEALRNAGLNIILVSEDNTPVLEAIALECGLLPSSNRMVLQGESFLNYSDEERMNNVDKIAVMGSSCPSDRLLLVQFLKKKGHRVAIIGVKTNDIPVLNASDVRIVIETCSSEMARESSDIIIRDGDFNILSTFVGCGRCIYDNIRKYIQLVITMNIAGLLISIVTTISFGSSPITAIEFLWGNFIVAFLGGLALLTEPPTGKLMNKPQLRQTEPLITKVMWRNLVSQVLYQVAILVTFQFKGKGILGIDKKVVKTSIFNSFVLCQLFNQFNARELERKNVFSRMHLNLLFWVAVVAILVLQVAFIEIAHIVAGYARLNSVQWFTCLLIGVVSLTIDWATKCTSGCIMD